MVVTWYIWKKKRKNKENENNVQRSNPTENCYANVNGDHAIIEYNSKQKPLSKHLITQENPVKNLDESYWETLDGVYDHLGDKETKQNKNDNVYDHAHFAAEPEDGVYDIGNRVKSKDKFQEEEATYDHAGSYSDYGQHGEQVDKMEDTYSRLYIKSRSGH
ncbi:uncharacterized protein LOC134233246 [Saccostrea cucullata]|uniref:uncharacterized protein LOC134233246 n=1 Tax=Saccostrea cuccullata TaxID=36930 RepID=UPI002ED69484